MELFFRGYWFLRVSAMFHQVLDRVVPFCLWLWCICSDRVVLFAAFVYTEFLRCSGRSLSLPNALSHTWGGKLAVIISPRPHIDPFVPSCLFRVFSSCFFPISLLFLSPSFPFPLFPFLVMSGKKPAGHAQACVCRSRKKWPTLLALGLFFCFGRMSCCRLDSTFFVWIALFPKVIFLILD